MSNPAIESTGPRRQWVRFLTHGFFFIAFIAGIVGVEMALRFAVPLYAETIPEMPFYICLFAFPVAVTYWVMKIKSSDDTLKKVKASILILLLVGTLLWAVSASKQIILLAPLMEMEESFTLPEGEWEISNMSNSNIIHAGKPLFALSGCWIDFGENYCPSVRRGWSEASSTPMTVEDLKEFAHKNDILVQETLPCEEGYGNRCSLIGERGPMEITLSYYNEEGRNDFSYEITLLKEDSN